ncbi:uncharacterized protein LOC120752183 isoform X3 [Hirundo rustica]|uniref:uncharacterized protein LOC120752183 isoform X3 n=1 Tax=Hirundo rustica TaxID=43150 RepID=UPI001A9494D4|nr:uncharacterized protein LOC120752183 isoform X3 [Hirundo rustica]XP_039918832.1 uncharacterized protein LOC120752183 isoform X3 [Hirundo rustica]
MQSGTAAPPVPVPTVRGSPGCEPGAVLLLDLPKMAAEKAGKVKDPEVRLAGCLRAILTTTRPEREFPRRFEGSSGLKLFLSLAVAGHAWISAAALLGDLCHAQRLWPAPGSQRAFPSHWALPDEAGKGEKILGKPQSLRLLFFPAKYPGASAVIPEDEERLGMRRRDLEPPFSQNDTSAESACSESECNLVFSKSPTST